MTVDELRALIAARREMAEKATPGPWKYPHRNWPGVVTSKFGCLWTSGNHGTGRINNDADGTHIAANDPATVIRNCDEDLAVLNRHSAHPDGRWCRVGVRPWPCPDVQGIARRYGRTLR